MLESGLFLPVFLFFSISISSLGWQILIKGTGIVDNLWLFFLLISMVFLMTTSIVSYFPFSGLSFFISILFFINFSTLYVYSFPRSIWPNYIWLFLITIANIAAIIVFLSFPDKKYLSYYAIPVLFSAINIPIIVRKIKYLESNKHKAVILHVSFIGILSIFLSASAGLSIHSYNALYFVTALTIIVPVLLILFGIVSFLNLNTNSGISQINFPLILFFSIPLSFLTKNMLTLRVMMLNVLGSIHFIFGAILILFVFFCILGILISMFSSSIEGFINRSRHYYQKYVNLYRVEIEKTTDNQELFSLFHASLKSWFSDLKSAKYIFFNDELAVNGNIPFELIEESDENNKILNDKKFIHEPYFAKNSVDSPPEIARLVNKYGGEVYLPVVFKTELVGFVILETKKFSHSATISISNILNMTVNRFEKLSLFTSVLEAEKKVEALKHFQETGKMVSFIAHELRSPLSSIMFNMEVIKDSIAKEKEPDPEYLDISLKEIKRLNETVEKMLTYGRNVKLTPFSGNFKSFFEELSYLFASDSERIRFIDNSREETFMFDWDLLKSVFINLINNSIQAITRNEGKGTVSVLVSRRRKKLIIEVSDTGPGIPEEHKSSIFEPFYTTRKEGNGLGLATCEKIVKLSGGTIFLKDTSQKGTTFQIILPVE